MSPFRRTGIVAFEWKDSWRFSLSGSVFHQRCTRTFCWLIHAARASLSVSLSPPARGPLTWPLPESTQISPATHTLPGAPGTGTASPARYTTHTERTADTQRATARGYSKGPQRAALPPEPIVSENDALAVRYPNYKTTTYSIHILL